MTERMEAIAAGHLNAKYEKLLASLADVPTPAGPTPRQLADGSLVQLQVGEQPTRSNDR